MTERTPTDAENPTSGGDTRGGSPAGGDPGRGPSWVFRSLSVALAVVALLVPRRDRARWIEEWRGELWHLLRSGREGGARAPVGRAVRRAAGAVTDAARLRFGKRPGGRARDRRGARGLLDDLRLAVRSLRRAPGFALFTVLILALGIGINTAVFSTARSAWTGALPYPEADRIVHVWERRPAQGRERNVASFPDFTDWREQTTVFDGMAAIRYTERNFSGGERPLPVFGALVTGDFFRVAGVEPALGRSFTPDETRPPGESVVVLGHGLWQDLFASDPDVLGRTVRVDLEPYTVVGVMPEGFDLPYGARYWLPLAIDPAESSRGGHGFDVLARLSPGVPIERARADLDEVARRLEMAYPDTNQGHLTAVYRLRDELLGDTRASLLLLLGAVGVVLLTVGVNVAILELARSTRRARDFAVRAALGAGRGRLLRQVLSESVVLSLVAAVASIGVAWLSHRALAGLNASRVPWGSPLGPDPGVLATSLGIALGTAFLFGLAPAVIASRTEVVDRLRGESSRVGLSRASRRWQSTLVAIQVALALVLLAGAGLFARNLIGLSAVDVGYDASSVVTADVSLPDLRYGTPAERLDFYQSLEARAAALPGVEATGTTWILPMSGRNVGRNFMISGRPMPEHGDELNLRLRSATAGYFEAMGMRVEVGRGIEAADGPDAPLVAVASRTLVERYWPDEDPIGQRVAWDEDGPWITIVGIVNEVRHDGPGFPAEPELYLPLPQSTPGGASLVVRTALPPEDTRRSLTAALRDIDPDQALARVGRLDANLGAALRRQREITQLVVAFACAALLLAAMGLYSVVGYSVSIRTREFGIRRALGGRRGQVLTEAMAGSARSVVAGLGLGLTVVLTAGHRLEAFLLEVGPRDPASLGLAVLLLLGTAGVAVLVPATRAVRVDPTESLRFE